MAMTAFEQNRHLIIDLGDGTVFTVPPIPGSTGREMLGILVSVSFGTDLENAEKNAQKLSRQSLGLPSRRGAKDGITGWQEREELYESLRASEQERISQAAILWNVQGGSIDAVHDLLTTEAGEAYPKALGRVMRSCGLGQQFDALRTWLSGESETPMSADSTAPTTGPTGTSSTSASETSSATLPA